MVSKSRAWRFELLLYHSFCDINGEIVFFDGLMDTLFRKIVEKECLLDDQKKVSPLAPLKLPYIRGVQNAIREILSVLLIQVSDLLKPGHNDRPLKNRSQNGSKKSTLAASNAQQK